MKKLNECLKAHPSVHTLFGIGIGLLLVGLFQGLLAQAVLLGIIVAVVALAADYFLVK